MICVLNGEVVTIPEQLVENEPVFKNVLSLKTLTGLSEEERERLKAFLPPKMEEVDAEDVIREIFEGSTNFKYQNPVKVAYEKIKNGLLAPEVVTMFEKCKRLKFKNYQLSQREYYKNLLEEIIISRQRVIDSAYKHGMSGLPQNNKSRMAMKNIHEYSYPAIDKANRRFQKMLRDISKECGDEEGWSTSDEEIAPVSQTVDGQADAAKDSQPDGGKILSVLPARSTDGLSEWELKRMLNYHKRRRIVADSHPELNTGSISIADVVMRCNSIKKTVKKKKKKKKSIKQSSSTKDKSKEGINESPPKKKKDPHKSVANMGYPKTSSFFSLIGYFFEQEVEKKCNRQKMEEKIRSWQSHKSSELSPWKMLYPDWRPLVQFTIDYMAGKGTSSLLNDFVPLLTPVDGNTWQWTGPDHKDDAVILPLYKHWMDTLTKVMVKHKNETPLTDEDRKVIDPARTLFVVRETSDEEKDIFRKQEKERYAKPYEAFIYKTHGYQSIVGPVKGVFSAKDVSTSKAREHAMLVSDRPPYVTILCIVRDAVARLPNGEGTRADVCTLLKDSQFLNPNATPQQVHGVVSGALDRLHAEKDPCVKFDPIRKVWLYLHRDRAVEEFEKLHQASGAAVLAKRQLSLSKQKAAKQKKIVEEAKETLEEISKKKEATTAKPRKIPNSSKQLEKEKQLVCDKKSESESEKSTELAIDLKKKAPKRKKSTPDTHVSKIAKPSPVEAKSDPPKDDFSLSFDNEALMATQSILGDDDPSDIFSESRSDVDFLNMDAFNSPNAVLPNLSLESSIGNSFNSSILNEISVADIDANLFSEEKLSPVSTEQEPFSQKIFTIGENSKDSNSSPTQFSLSSDDIERKPLNKTKQLSDILSEKALSILKPRAETLKVNLPNQSGLLNKPIQQNLKMNSQINLIGEPLTAKELDLSKTQVEEHCNSGMQTSYKVTLSGSGSFSKSLVPAQTNTRKSTNATGDYNIHKSHKTKIHANPNLQIKSSSNIVSNNPVNKPIFSRPFTTNITPSTNSKPLVIPGQSISVRVQPAGMLLSSQSKKKPSQLKSSNSEVSLQTLSKFIISNNSKVTMARSSASSKSAPHSQIGQLKSGGGTSPGEAAVSPIARLLGQGTKAICIGAKPTNQDINPGQVKQQTVSLSRSQSLPSGYQMVNVKSNSNQQGISPTTHKIQINQIQNHPVNKAMTVTKVNTDKSKPISTQNLISQPIRLGSGQVISQSASSDTQVQGVKSIQALLHLTQRGATGIVSPAKIGNKAASDKPKYIAIPKNLVSQAQGLVNMQRSNIVSNSGTSQQGNQSGQIFLGTTGQMQNRGPPALSQTNYSRTVVAPLKISLPKTTLAGASIRMSTQGQRIPLQGVRLTSPLNSPAQQTSSGNPFTHSQLKKQSDNNE